MKKTGLQKLAILVCTVLLWTGISVPALADTASDAGNTWTVLLYLCGTDLESEDGAASSNLGELMAVNVPENIHFIIETGGTSQWQTGGIDPEALQRWEMTADGISLADEQPLASMGDAQTLGDFLSWGVQSYPADHYMVVFWDHGGGAASGLVFDELFDDDSLSISELSSGLTAAGVRFEVIGFDTCLMATLENAAAISAYGNYMVASEETEPGGGWNYTDWLQYLCDHPETDGLGLGTEICDSYMEKCESEGEAEMATLSVTDLTAMDDLLTKFDTMAAEMTGVTSDITTYQAFVQGVRRAENYGGNNDNEGYTNMVDLGDLAVNTENVLSETAVALLDSLFATVKYNVKGQKRSEANGLSVYYPLSVNNDELTVYADTAATSGNYLRFIQAIANTDWEAPQGTADDVPVVSTAVQEDDYSIDLSTYVTEDDYYALEIGGDMDSVASVNFGIYYLDYDYNEYLMLGVDNDIMDDWDNGYFEDNFRGVWPTINGCFCEPTLLAETDEYNLYTIPILLNGRETSLRAAYVWDSEEDGHFEVYGTWDGIDSDTGMSARDIIQLQDGDEVTLLFDAVNWDTGETNTYEMDSFTVNGDVTMEESDLIDGEYLYQYIVTDVFGRVFYSDTAIMEYNEGDIYVSMDGEDEYSSDDDYTDYVN
ncbi:MAG: clostripain-related cysteine peptidase [Eubacteriales bacterium]|nr:clostripain-related cysteine peptidase [Eubacteriales bacterium]